MDYRPLSINHDDNTDGFSRLEKDKEKIKALYHDGYTKGLLFSDKVKEFYTK